MAALIEAEDSPSRVCRYCLEVENDNIVPVEPLEMVSPCGCSGSQQYVHKSCLYKWQISQITASLSTRNADRDKHLICGICGEAFSGVDTPDTVDVIESFVGADAVRSLGLGALLVATRSSSDRAVPDLNHMFIMLLNLKRAHWKYSVYFVFEHGADRSSGIIRALNLTRLMDNSVDKPVPDEILLARERYSSWLRIFHFNGGPVCWSSVRTGVCVLDVAPEAMGTAECCAPDMVLITRTPSSTILVAPFQVLVEYLVAHYRVSSGPETEGEERNIPLTVFSFSGYAQWDRLQLLGEINRKSWGVVGADSSIQQSGDHCWGEEVLTVLSGEPNALWSKYHATAYVGGGGVEEGGV